jgi:hypothetical protein
MEELTEICHATSKEEKGASRGAGLLISTAEDKDDSDEDE